MQTELAAAPPPTIELTPWYKTLTRYHWFVLAVAALGWMFDTMDQQLFNLARVPAMRALVVTATDEPSVARDKISEFGGYATSIFLIGWATGGLAFGILGDRFGRAKTMMLTILLYSLFTGLSALSTNFFEFALFRFLTGLGVGGEFAVGVSLVAEVMPDRARPFALGLLQGLSAVGNITAAVVSMILGSLQIRDSWKLMFLIGTVPALLCLFIFRHLKEPERWLALKQAAREGRTREKLGSLTELFGNPRWRQRAIIGLILSSSGIIGLWAIGFFSIDLNRSVLRKAFEHEAWSQEAAAQDRTFVREILRRLESDGRDADSREALKGIQASDLLGTEAKLRDTQLFFKAIQAAETNRDAALTGAAVHQTAERLVNKEIHDPAQRADVLARIRNLISSADKPPPGQLVDLTANVERIAQRSRQIAGRLDLWAGITSLMLNLGAALGIYCFTRFTQRTGRRPAFAVAYILAMFSTAWVFLFLNDLSDVFWMIPIMGFCQLALFGGYAIYFPELFPTRLRSTGTSFCYNVARYVAASGPFTLGLLSKDVFGGFDEPMRYAGVTMCSVFLIGLCALPFAPETKGQPLPE